MPNIPASLKKDLGQLAAVLNQFKSEAVQVKLLEQFFSGASIAAAPAPAPAAAPARRGRPPGSGKKKAAKAAAPTAAPARRGRPPGSGAKKVAKAAAPAPAPTAKPGRKKRGKMGATGALYKLIAAGFFKTHRTIADVTAACKSKLGLDIAVTNLSGPLMRFVDEKKLVRAKNKDQKFEYWAK